MTERLFPSPIEVLDNLLLPFLSEDRLVETGRKKLEESHPNGPIDWAIRYAKSNTDRITKDIQGPLRPLIRKAVLQSQLVTADTYLGSMTEFLELENPIDKKDI